MKLSLLMMEILGSWSQCVAKAVAIVSPVSLWQILQRTAEMFVPGTFTVDFHDSKRCKSFDKHQLNIRTTLKPTQFQKIWFILISSLPHLLTAPSIHTQKFMPWVERCASAITSRKVLFHSFQWDRGHLIPIIHKWRLQVTEEVVHSPSENKMLSSLEPFNLNLSFGWDFFFF